MILRSAVNVTKKCLHIILLAGFLGCSTESSSPEPTPSPLPGINQLVKSHDYEFTVNEIKRMDSLKDTKTGAEVKARPAHEFLILSLTVKKIDGNPNQFSYKGANANIVDPNYEHPYIPQGYEYSGYLTNEFPLQNYLEIGDSLSGEIIYLVKKEAPGKWFEIYGKDFLDRRRYEDSYKPVRFELR